jgi:putative colanic acid biosynthesis glycosyltransferase
MRMRSGILLSIIIVTYEDIDGLTRTLQSLLPLRPADQSRLEVLVIDGGSGPGLDAVQQEFGQFATFQSEPDDGVYDAMNKGLAHSSGDFVWFLNGGDSSAVNAWSDVEQVLTTRVGRMLLCSYWLDFGRRRLLRRPRSASYIWHGLPTSHQAILYPGQTVRAAKYDVRYTMAADYEITARLIAQGVDVDVIDIAIATFYSGGMSYTGAQTVAKEAAIVQREILALSRLRRLRSSIKHALSRWARRALTKV